MCVICGFFFHNPYTGRADVFAADGAQAAVGALLAQRPPAEGHVRRPAALDDVPDVGVEHDNGVVNSAH